MELRPRLTCYKILFGKNGSCGSEFPPVASSVRRYEWFEILAALWPEREKLLSIHAQVSNKRQLDQLSRKGSKLIQLEVKRRWKFCTLTIYSPTRQNLLIQSGRDKSKTEPRNSCRQVVWHPSQTPCLDGPVDYSRCNKYWKIYRTSIDRNSNNLFQST